MPKASLKKDKWTITFDHSLKKRVQQEAKRLRVYPVQLLETLVRERLDPYGFQSVVESITYVNAIRKKSALKSDRSFLEDLGKWQKK